MSKNLTVMHYLRDAGTKVGQRGGHQEKRGTNKYRRANLDKKLMASKTLFGGFQGLDIFKSCK